MGKDSAISWTKHTFNPWWGCVEVSPACDNCYARELAVGRWGHDVWGKDKPRRFFTDKHWKDPILWDAAAARAGKKDRVFCASMADVFEERDDLDPWRERLFDLIEKTPNLNWMLLTKRENQIEKRIRKAWLDKPRENVWLGVTAENQRRAEERIPVLLEVPAVVHWISAEPLLGPINFMPFMKGASRRVTDDGIDAPDGAVIGGEERGGESWFRKKGIDWVIVGGESGDSPRKMEAEWARDILDQCRRRNVAYHFKQKGRLLAAEMKCKDREGKDRSEWPLDLQVQEFPALAV
jgi:protein gp37